MSEPGACLPFQGRTALKPGEGFKAGGVRGGCTLCSKKQPCEAFAGRKLYLLVKFTITFIASVMMKISVAATFVNLDSLASFVLDILFS